MPNNALNIAALRQEFKAEQSRLKADFLKDNNVTKSLRSHCKVVDALLKQIWLSFNLSEVTLVAVGGYGRGELFPHSDVDLLILLPHKAMDNTLVEIEKLIGILWDIGLNVGHSVRNGSECLVEAQKDVTVLTNLMEARYLTGEKALFKHLLFSIENEFDSEKFFSEKMLEQNNRHLRFNNTSENLEPNIKESPGGLRDLHMVLWIARSLHIGKKWQDLVHQGLLNNKEARQIKRCERDLSGLRIRLHLMASRREDRLLFDYQNDLAADFGFKTNSKYRASEQLMQRYYKAAKFVRLMNEMLLATLREKLYPANTQRQSIHADYAIQNGLLDLKDPQLFEKQPAAMLSCFLLLQSHDELAGFSPDLIRSLHKNQHLIDAQFRKNHAHQQLFIKLLKQPFGTTHILKRMNQYGILGRYIPAFGKIVGQMQHDLFHVYTVDEHILNVLGNVRRFTLPKYQLEFPLCSQLIAEFEAPYLLYLAAIFHDIAKGRGGDHSTLGTVDARRFCIMHGLEESETQLVAWLVESHLKMSSVAQKSDLADPQVLQQFADFVGTKRKLIALYLLTVADIRGTSPKVWNAWKANLLEHLFKSTRGLLTGIKQNATEELSKRQEQAAITLRRFGLTESAFKPLWELLGNDYFIRHESQEIAWHSRLLSPHLRAEKPIVRCRLSPVGNGIQVMIYMQNRDDLFARICSFFERIDYNIVEAKIHTTEHGYALDSFLVLDTSDKSIVYKDLLNYIEHELTENLDQTTLPLLPSAGRLSRQVKHQPISTKVELFPLNTSNASQQYVLEIIAGDRPGLLYNLAYQFVLQGIQLHTAKINTLGNRAEDRFLISTKTNILLDEQKLISSLQAYLA